MFRGRPPFQFRRFNVIDSLLERKIEKRPDKVRLQGRILFLTEDPELIKRQLAGEDLPWDTKNPANNPKLRDDISTDEITPAHYCFYFDETLGEIPYLGLKCGNVTPIGRGDVKRGGFVCAVSGKRRGKGSSREQSPYAEMCAGHSRGDCRKHRAHLQAELPEPGAADFDELFADRSHSGRGRDCAQRIHRRRR